MERHFGYTHGPELIALFTRCALNSEGSLLDSPLTEVIRPSQCHSCWPLGGLGGETEMRTTPGAMVTLVGPSLLSKWRRASGPDSSTSCVTKNKVESDPCHW